MYGRMNMHWTRYEVYHRCKRARTCATYSHGYVYLCNRSPLRVCLVRVFAYARFAGQRARGRAARAFLLYTSLNGVCTG